MTDGGSEAGAGETMLVPPVTKGVRAKPATGVSWAWKIAISVVLVVLADVLFFEHPVGWTLGGFAFALLIAVAALNPKLLKRPVGRVLFALDIGLCLALVEYPSALPILLYVVGLASFACADRRLVFKDTRHWMEGLFLFYLQAFLRWAFGFEENTRKGVTGPTTTAKSRDAKNRDATADRIVKLANVWLLPLFFTAVFVGLFFTANPILTQWFDWLRQSPTVEPPSPVRILLWIGVAMATWAFLQPRVMRLGVKRKYPKAKGSQPDTGQASGQAAQQDFDPWDFLFSKEAIVRSMVLFNALFALQNTLDLTYLWGGRALPVGLTFADYAHRGAYPLILTALLAAAFVLLAFRPGSEAAHSRLVRGLTYLWIAQNVLLVASSIWRTWMYIDVYSLTYLRIAAMIWMGLVATGLVWIALRLAWKKSNMWLVDANVLTALSVLYVASFVNFGGIIADHNVRHAKEVGGDGALLDLDYLESIGPDALPAMQWYIAHSPNIPVPPETTEDPVSVPQVTPMDPTKIWPDPIDGENWEKISALARENDMARAKIAWARMHNSRRERAQRIAEAFQVQVNGVSSNWRAWTFRWHRLAKTVPHR